MAHSEQTMESLSKSFAAGTVENKTCEAHGDYTSTVMTVAGRKVGGVCPKCFAEREEVERVERQAKIDAEQRHHRTQSMFGRAAIPERFKLRGFGSYDAKTDEQKANRQACIDYATDFETVRAEGRCMVMTGKPGTGKTHLAVAIARAVMKAGGDALYARAYEVFQSVKETYSRDSSKSERQVIDEFVRPDLLVLDEIGVQYGTDAEKVILYAIINARYDRCLPTVIVSNLPLSGIESYMGERAFDRLRENGGQTLTFDWGSYRKGAA